MYLLSQFNTAMAKKKVPDARSTGKRALWETPNIKACGLDGIRRSDKSAEQEGDELIEVIKGASSAPYSH